MAALGIGEAPLGLQGTFSLWRSATALRDFAYKGRSSPESDRTDRGRWLVLAKSLFARFEVLEQRGDISAKSAR